MKKYIAIIISILTLPILLNATTDEDIIKAMKDEMQRSINELKMDNLESPYYIEYKYTIHESNNIDALLGNIVNNQSDKRATLDVDVHVGSYKFDNTNFAGGGMFLFGGGSRDDEERYSNRLVSYELDYDNLRRELWLATDAAYKKSAENFSKKQAALKNKIRKDTTWDFLQLKKSEAKSIQEIPAFDKNKYEEILKEMSATFLKYPEVFTSKTALENIVKKEYYYNSEGSQYIKVYHNVGVEVSASSQADDGMIITNFYSCYGRKLSDLPNKDSLIKAADEVGAEITELLKAPVLEDTYAGPVLMTGEAAAEIFAQVFVPNLITRREKVSSTGFPSNPRFAAFQRKIGGRVLPEFMSMNAYPTKAKEKYITLFGTFRIDDEGVIAQDVELVKKGYLKNLFSSRIPTKRIRTSNGHKRNGSPSFSNVYITVDDKDKQLPYKKLVKKMMKLCKDRELEYGLVIKKIMNPNIFSSSIIEQIFSGDFSYMRSSAINLVEVYKVYPDGREELVRGAEGAGFTHQSFKDIIYCSDNSYVYNFWGSASGYGGWHGASIVTPDILFEDGEIRTIDADFKKPPFVATPLK